MMKAAANNRVLCIGECMLEFADQGAGLFRLGYAGDTFNTAWHCRKLLPEDWSVDYCTAIGDDFYSGRMRDFFIAHGIGVQHVRPVPNTRAGLYLIRQDQGDRHFTYWRGQSAAKSLADDARFLGQAAAGARLIYFSGITLAILNSAGRANLLAMLAAARAAGAIIAFDPNERPALWPAAGEMRAAIESAARHSDWVFPTFPDAAQHFGDVSPQAVAQRYLGYGAREVAVKNGAEDALVATGKVMIGVPAQRAGKVVDPTGAGDSFNAAYMAARLTGKTLEQAAQDAHAVAAKVIGHHGAIAADDRGA